MTTRCTSTAMAWTFVASIAAASRMGATVLRHCRIRCSLGSSSTLMEGDQTQSSPLSQARARLCHSVPPHSANLVTSIPLKSSTTVCLCDSSTRCRCHETTTCLRLVPTQMQRMTKVAHSQTATCQHRSFHRWMMAHSTSIRATSGKRTCPTSSTLCKRDIRQDPHVKPSRLGLPKYIHHKTIGVQGEVV